MPSGPARASAAYPAPYRVILTVIEPLFAVCGAALVLVRPRAYLSTMSRGLGVFSADSTFMYTTAGGAWLYFAFVEAVVLRAYDDARLWRLLCAGMLLSDAAYCVSVVQAVGGWDRWVDLAAWTTDDWVAFAATAPMVLVRILIVLGVGVRAATTGKKRK
ncbi:hypothetical protein AAL_07264 [Moelleriella libera RCEF 2490]|uniref:DUF7704 domain-containing protein n=1 Tax=Moelleriella libera RCEF 2490 TaxID=1081109 RepID=A0A162I8U6_9HYPO|nr:hypothetical protein AAL_07264 [Moelleriella libera RCEF 2490]